MLDIVFDEKYCGIEMERCNSKFFYFLKVK